MTEESVARLTQLGDSIASRLTADTSDLAAFAAVAESELLGAGEIVPPSLLELADYVVSKQGVRQENHPFSDAPLVIYRHPVFCIEILHWLHATTSIHSHAFAGAFRVLQGSSLHTTYQVNPVHWFDDGLAAVDATATFSEKLELGSVRRIDPGRTGLVHSLYHLESPSISLVVRTYGERDQFSLLRPGLWYNELRLLNDDRIRAVERMIRCADVIQQGRGADVLRRVSEQVDDSAWVFLLIRQVRRFDSADAFDAMLCDRKRSCESLNERLRAAYRPARVAELIESARVSITDPEIRMFLAVLLNVSSRDAIYSLLAADTGATRDAYEVMADRILALARFRGDPAQRLARIAAAGAVDVRLGVDLRRALDLGCSDTELRNALVAVLDGSASDKPSARVEDLRTRLRTIPALASLVR